MYYRASSVIRFFNLGKSWTLLHRLGTVGQFLSKQTWSYWAGRWSDGLKLEQWIHESILYTFNTLLLLLLLFIAKFTILEKWHKAGKSYARLDVYVNLMDILYYTTVLQSSVSATYRPLMFPLLSIFLWRAGKTDRVKVFNPTVWTTEHENYLRTRWVSYSIKYVRFVTSASRQ